jgi:hypothetical protein
VRSACLLTTAHSKFNFCTNPISASSVRSYASHVASVCMIKGLSFYLQSRLDIGRHTRKASVLLSFASFGAPLGHIAQLLQGAQNAVIHW